MLKSQQTQTRRFNRLTKTTAAFTLLFFMLSSTLQAESFYAPIPAQPLKTLPISEKISIPSELGNIQSEHLSENKGPFVVFIQDAHAIVDAQINMQKMIDHLEKNYGFTVVGIEGGQGELDPTILQTFPDENLKSKVLNEYLERGELSGTEMSSIMNQGKTYYYGIEDWKIYENNYFAYLRAAKKRQQITEELAVVKESLDTERKNVFSAELNTFHEKHRAFRDEKINLLDFLKFLKELPQAKNKTAKYEHLKNLMDSVEKDAAMDKSGLEVAVRSAADDFKKRQWKLFTKDENMVFNSKYQSFVTGSMDTSAFLKWLLEYSASKNESIQLSSSMKELLGQAETLSMIKGTKLFEELKTFIEEIENKLAANPEQKEILQKYHRMDLLTELAALEISRDQLEDYRKNNRLYVSLLKTPELLNPALDFYRFALDRDEALHQNFLKLIREKQAKAAIVVLGGFHSQGFEQKLKSDGFSYLVVTPKMDSMKGHEQYESVMNGNLSYKSLLKTSFYDAFVRHSTLNLISKLNENDFRKVIKFWRDQLIRKLAQEGRLAESSQYTGYLDLLVKAYIEKFGAASLTGKKKKEEVLADIQKELEKFRDNTIDQKWKRFETQLNAFTSGLSQLVKTDQLSINSVKALMVKSTRTQPAALKEISTVALIKDGPKTDLLVDVVLSGALPAEAVPTVVAAQAPIETQAGLPLEISSVSQSLINASLPQGIQSTSFVNEGETVTSQLTVTNGSASSLGARNEEALQALEQNLGLTREELLRTNEIMDWMASNGILFMETYEKKKLDEKEYFYANNGELLKKVLTQLQDPRFKGRFLGEDGRLNIFSKRFERRLVSEVLRELRSINLTKDRQEVSVDLAPLKKSLGENNFRPISFNGGGVILTQGTNQNLLYILKEDAELYLVIDGKPTKKFFKAGSILGENSALPEINESGELVYGKRMTRATVKVPKGSKPLEFEEIQILPPTEPVGSPGRLESEKQMRAVLENVKKLQESRIAATNLQAIREAGIRRYRIEAEKGPRAIVSKEALARKNTPNPSDTQVEALIEAFIRDAYFQPLGQLERGSKEWLMLRDLIKKFIVENGGFDVYDPGEVIHAPEEGERGNGKYHYIIDGSAKVVSMEGFTRRTKDGGRLERVRISKGSSLPKGTGFAAYAMSNQTRHQNEIVADTAVIAFTMTQAHYAELNILLINLGLQKAEPFESEKIKRIEGLEEKKREELRKLETSSEKSEKPYEFNFETDVIQAKLVQDYGYSADGRRILRIRNLNELLEDPGIPLAQKMSLLADKAIKDKEKKETIYGLLLEGNAFVYQNKNLEWVVGESPIQTAIKRTNRNRAFIQGNGGRSLNFQIVKQFKGLSHAGLLHVANSLEDVKTQDSSVEVIDASRGSINVLTGTFTVTGNEIERGDLYFVKTDAAMKLRGDDVTPYENVLRKTGVSVRVIVKGEKGESTQKTVSLPLPTNGIIDPLQLRKIIADNENIDNFQVAILEITVTAPRSWEVLRLNGKRFADQFNNSSEYSVENFIATLGEEGYSITPEQKTALREAIVKATSDYPRKDYNDLAQDFRVRLFRAIKRWADYDKTSRGRVEKPGLDLVQLDIFIKEFVKNADKKELKHYIDVQKELTTNYKQYGDAINQLKAAAEVGITADERAARIGALKADGRTRQLTMMLGIDLEKYLARFAELDGDKLDKEKIKAKLIGELGNLPDRLKTVWVVLRLVTDKKKDTSADWRGVKQLFSEGIDDIQQVVTDALISPLELQEFSTTEGIPENLAIIPDVHEGLRELREWLISVGIIDRDGKLIFTKGLKIIQQGDIINRFVSDKGLETLAFLQDLMAQIREANKEHPEQDQMGLKLMLGNHELDILRGLYDKAIAEQMKDLTPEARKKELPKLLTLVAEVRKRLMTLINDGDLVLSNYLGKPENANDPFAGIQMYHSVLTPGVKVELFKQMAEREKQLELDGKTTELEEFRRLYPRNNYGVSNFSNLLLKETLGGKASFDGTEVLDFAHFIFSKSRRRRGDKDQSGPVEADFGPWTGTDFFFHLVELGLLKNDVKLNGKDVKLTQLEADDQNNGTSLQREFWNQFRTDEKKFEAVQVTADDFAYTKGQLEAAVLKLEGVAENAYFVGLKEELSKVTNQAEAFEFAKRLFGIQFFGHNFSSDDVEGVRPVSMFDLVFPNLIDVDAGRRQAVMDDMYENRTAGVARKNGKFFTANTNVRPLKKEEKPITQTQADKLQSAIRTVIEGKRNMEEERRLLIARETAGESKDGDSERIVAIDKKLDEMQQFIDNPISLIEPKTPPPVVGLFNSELETNPDFLTRNELYKILKSGLNSPVPTKSKIPNRDLRLLSRAEEGKVLTLAEGPLDLTNANLDKHFVFAISGTFQIFKDGRLIETFQAEEGKPGSGTALVRRDLAPGTEIRASAGAKVLTLGTQSAAVLNNISLQRTIENLIPSAFPLSEQINKDRISVQALIDRVQAGEKDAFTFIARSDAAENLPLKKAKGQINVGLYPTVANPFTTVQAQTVLKTMESQKLDEVVISLSPFHADGRVALTAEQLAVRVAQIRQIFKGNPKISIAVGGSVLYADFATNIQTLVPESVRYLILGLDNLERLAKPENPANLKKKHEELETILSKTSLLVISSGVQKSDPDQELSAERKFQELLETYNVPETGVSGTTATAVKSVPLDIDNVAPFIVRALIASGEPLEALVKNELISQETKELIEKFGLFAGETVSDRDRALARQKYQEVITARAASVIVGQSMGGELTVQIPVITIAPEVTALLTGNELLSNNELLQILDTLIGKKERIDPEDIQALKQELTKKAQENLSQFKGQLSGDLDQFLESLKLMGDQVDTFIERIYSDDMRKLISDKFTQFNDLEIDQVLQAVRLSVTEAASITSQQAFSATLTADQMKVLSDWAQKQRESLEQEFAQQRNKKVTLAITLPENEDAKIVFEVLNEYSKFLNRLVIIHKKGQSVPRNALPGIPMSPFPLLAQPDRTEAQINRTASDIFYLLTFDLGLAKVNKKHEKLTLLSAIGDIPTPDVKRMAYEWTVISLLKAAQLSKERLAELNTAEKIKDFLEQQEGPFSLDFDITPDGSLELRIAKFIQSLVEAAEREEKISEAA